MNGTPYMSWTNLSVLGGYSTATYPTRGPTTPQLNVSGQGAQIHIDKKQSEERQGLFKKVPIWEMFVWLELNEEERALLAQTLTWEE